MIPISVIVPVYNAERTLRECIDSILSQEFKDFELLLVNDGSKDGSAAICDDYAREDNRVKVFHKENGGVSSARNLGLDHAKGDWITFIDSDDYITKDYLEGVVSREENLIIKGYKNVINKGIVGGRMAEEVVQYSGFTSFLNQYITETLLRGPVFKFYKKSLVGNLRFLHDMKIGEDAWFVFKYLTKCKSLAVVPNGEYMVRLAEEPDEVKYAISVDYAVKSLQYLRDAFDGLIKSHGINKSHFLAYIGYFKRISKADWQSNKVKWYNNPQVKELYDYVWPSLSFKQKIRLIAAKLIKK